VILPGGKRIDYAHDPLGRRIAKVVNGAVVEKYLWEGMTRLLAVYSGSNALLLRFEYADDRMPVAMTAGGVRYYLGYDQVGSLITVADGSGSVVKRITYDSFGNSLDDTNPGFGVPFGFAGGLHDRDTGLVRFGYRDYDPEVGRWTAKDPIGFAGGDTDLYGYVLSDPISLIDPEGKIVNFAIGAVSGAFGGYISGGWKGAVIGSIVGTATAAIFPSVSYSAGSIAGSMLVGGLSNLLGQVIGNLSENGPNASYSINWGALAASAFAGAFAPFWVDIGGVVFGGSWLAEGLLGGLSAGYFELAGQTIWDMYSECPVGR